MVIVINIIKMAVNYILYMLTTLTNIYIMGMILEKWYLANSLSFLIRLFAF